MEGYVRMEDIKLEGINKTIYKWALKSAMIKKLAWLNDEAKTELKDALGKDVDKRYRASINLCENVWSFYPELGMYPNLDLLSDVEFGRVFYNGYRDHTTHVFKVYLLGLMIYEQNEIIRNKFMEQGIQEDRFAITWTATSLWHDMGYLFENEEVGKLSEFWTNIKTRINAQYELPLSTFNSIGITPAKERKLYNVNDLNGLTILDSVLSIEDENNFETLKSAGIASGLIYSDAKNSIKELYDYIKGEHTTGKRLPYKDHGISSALLLLKAWRGYEKKLRKTVEIWNNASKNSVLGKVVENKITDLYNDVSSLKSIIEDAAKAIALHNISKNEWMPEAIDAVMDGKDIDIASFYIFIDDSQEDYSAQPFAFLLKLADELQMWDRVGFVAPIEGKTPLSGADLDILVNDTSIGIWFEDDDNSYKKLEHPNTKYSKLKKNLSDCKHIDKFLRPLRSSQIPWHNDIVVARSELVSLFYSNSAKELMTLIKDKYQCKEVRVLLRNRSKYTDNMFEFLQLNGNSSPILDEGMLEFARDNYFNQTSNVFPIDRNKKTGFAIISTYVGPVGFLVLEDIPSDVCFELLSSRSHISRLSDYGVMYGNLLLMKLREIVESEKALGGLEKADELRGEINKYIPFGNNNCISVFLDIRGFSKLLSDDREILKQRSLQFINGFSNSVQKISAQHFGIISTHFGGGMLITFNQVFREELSESCFRATCAMHKIRNSFKSIAVEIFGEKEAKEIMNTIDIGMGASVGQVFFSTLGVNACVYYTGVGNEIGFAKKIENISGRDEVSVKHIPLRESDSEKENSIDKIFVSDSVHVHCSSVEGWAELKPVETRVSYDDKPHILYYLGKINQTDCPLPKDKRCLCFSKEESVCHAE